MPHDEHAFINAYFALAFGNKVLDDAEDYLRSLSAASSASSSLLVLDSRPPSPRPVESYSSLMYDKALWRKHTVDPICLDSSSDDDEEEKKKAALAASSSSGAGKKRRRRRVRVTIPATRRRVAGGPTSPVVRHDPSARPWWHWSYVYASIEEQRCASPFLQSVGCTDDEEN